MNASPGRVEAIGDARTVFLNEALGPLRQWLDNEKVVEIIANGPGELFVEIIGESAMQRVESPAITVDWLRHLAERVAGYSNQSVNAEHPLLSAALATGERFQGRVAAGDHEWRRLRYSQTSHQGNVARRLPQDGLLRSREGFDGG